MAENTYLIHNMFRAHSSHKQRALSATPHTAVERIAGRRIVPKRPIRVSEEEFKANETEIFQKIREGRLAVTLPDLTFIDSRPDGRLYKVFVNKKIEEEKVAIDLTKDSVDSEGTDGGLDDLGPTGAQAPTGWQGPQGPAIIESGFGKGQEGANPGMDGLTGAVGEVGPPESTPGVEPIPSDTEKLIQTGIPPVQDMQTITLDTPKSKKRRKE
jgi:hypothetical protein